MYINYAKSYELRRLFNTFPVFYRKQGFTDGPKCNNIEIGETVSN